jgi:protein-S-isoprenylcysteine O-methyltransferase Ste14
MKLHLRALGAFLACPGVVAGVLPVLIGWGRPPAAGWREVGCLPLALGAAGLVWCVRDFLVSGRGTLAPWDPPRRLVVVGLYRFVRNPMYLAVLTIVLGWALYFGSWWLGLYLAVGAVAVHLRVIGHEEPWLQRQFGEDWVRYRQAVRRWLPRLRAAEGTP